MTTAAAARCTYGHCWHEATAVESMSCCRCPAKEVWQGMFCPWHPDRPATVGVKDDVPMCSECFMKVYPMFGRFA